jgi:hypothetical protein
MLSRNDVLQIFKRHAEFQRDMDMERFLSALDSTAITYFNEDYDELNPALNATNRPVEEKRILLYKYIQCGNKNHIFEQRN